MLKPLINIYQVLTRDSVTVSVDAVVYYRLFILKSYALDVVAIVVVVVAVALVVVFVVLMY